MQSSPQFVMQASTQRCPRREDVPYQIMTVAAMLIVLVSVWVF